jgi:hypothetical protein
MPYLLNRDKLLFLFSATSDLLLLGYHAFFEKTAFTPPQPAQV